MNTLCPTTSRLTPMLKAPSIVPDSDESVVENSTAPTTPDGSLTFSPIIHAANLGDAFDGAAPGSSPETQPGKNLAASLDLDEALPVDVKNICCVGAGYVGKFEPLSIILISYLEAQVLAIKLLIHSIIY
jgi:hypothetical protein